MMSSHCMQQSALVCGEQMCRSQLHIKETSRWEQIRFCCLIVILYHVLDIVSNKYIVVPLDSAVFLQTRYFVDFFVYFMRY